MLTKIEVEKLQTEAINMKAQLDALKQVDVSAIKSDYEKQISDLTNQIELLKQADSIVASEVYKKLASENEANKTKISELEEQSKTLQVNKEDNQKLVNTMVQEKLASLGVAPIKVQTSEQQPKKKVSYASADEYFASIK